jgi:hypothetical protein
MTEREPKFLRKVLRSRKADPLKWPFAKPPGPQRVLGELERNHPVALVLGIRGSGNHPNAGAL